MKINKLTLLLLQAFLFSLVSCQPQNPYAGPPIPLADALVSISQGMRKADEAAGGGKSTGLIPAKATATFNVVNSTTDTHGVTLNVVPVAGATAGGTFGRETSQQGTSTITVEYSSVCDDN